MNSGNIAGTALGIKLVNGKFKPKFNLLSYIVLTIFILLFIVFFVAFIYGIINLNLEFIIIPSIGMFGTGYIILITPYTQKASNYKIELKKENSLAGFKLFYKDKKVIIKHKIDDNGKFAFGNNYKKLDCVSYADGKKMSNFTKYRIINYFGRWLQDNNLMSSLVTVTFEKL